MSEPICIDFEEAAKLAGVFSPDQLRKEAIKHGLAVQMGRKWAIQRSKVIEVIEKCQTQENRPASTSAQAEPGTSTMVENRNQQALSAAEKLKRRSPDTSQKGTTQSGQVLQMKK